MSTTTSYFDDPSHPKYLTTCYVCQDKAKPGQQHLRNYGGIVCLGCRAFWRRIHQNTRTPNLKCKMVDMCQITVVSRRHCKKCRFVRCQAAGMDPNAVLDPSQKTVRFRRLLKKLHKGNKRNPEVQIGEFPKIIFKRKRAQPKENTDNLESVIESDIEPDDDSSIGTIRKTESCQRLAPGLNLQPKLRSKTKKSKKSETESEISAKRSKIESENIISDDTSLQIKIISKAFAIATGQARTLESDRLFQKLISLNTANEFSSDLSKEDLLNVIKELSQVFRHFALILREFRCLGKQLQRKLLSRNTPLFVQLCMGLYLHDQGPHTPDSEAGTKTSSHKRAWLNIFKQKSRIEDLNEQTKLFLPSADLNQYASLVWKMNGLSVLSTIELNSVLAFGILFDSDETFSQEETVMLASAGHMREMMFNSRIKLCQNCSGLDIISTILVKMAKFCAQNIDWEEHRTLDFQLRHISTMSLYEREEEHWLSNQNSLMEDAFRSVVTGEKLLQGFLMISQGYQVPDDQLSGVFKVMTERTIRACKIHPEFESLSPELKHSIVLRNVPLGVGLLLAKTENCESGMEQLQDGLGELDEIRWRQDYLPNMKDFDEIKRMTLEYGRIFSEETLVEYHSHVKNLKSICSNPEMFKLVFLLAITRPGDQYSQLTEVHNKYIILMQKKIMRDSEAQMVHSSLFFIFSKFKSIEFLGKLTTGVVSS